MVQNARFTPMMVPFFSAMITPSALLSNTVAAWRRSFSMRLRSVMSSITPTSPPTLPSGWVKVALWNITSCSCPSAWRTWLS